ncbi:MAG: hypothetical protein WCZ99_00735 [Candidatus Paceibacterota bacterium]
MWIGRLPLCLFPTSFSSLPPNPVSKKIFEGVEITADLVLLHGRKVANNRRVFWYSGSKYALSVFRQLSPFRTLHKRVSRKMLLVHYSISFAACLAPLKLLALYQKFSLKQLAGVCPREFRQHSEIVQHKTDWKG